MLSFYFLSYLLQEVSGASIFGTWFFKPRCHRIHRQDSLSLKQPNESDEPMFSNEYKSSSIEDISIDIDDIEDDLKLLGSPKIGCFMDYSEPNDAIDSIFTESELETEKFDNVIKALQQSIKKDRRYIDLLKEFDIDFQKEWDENHPILDRPLKRNQEYFCANYVSDSCSSIYSSICSSSSPSSDSSPSPHLFPGSPSPSPTPFPSSPNPSLYAISPNLSPSPDFQMCHLTKFEPESELNILDQAPQKEISPAIVGKDILPNTFSETFSDEVAIPGLSLKHPLSGKIYAIDLISSPSIYSNPRSISSPIPSPKPGKVYVPIFLDENYFSFDSVDKTCSMKDQLEEDESFEFIEDTY